jgi:hypothetical protein
MSVFEKIFPAIDKDYCKCGWGLDGTWSDDGIFNTYVIDSCIMFHTRPSNSSSGFYKTYNINPYEEMQLNINCLKSILQKQ